MRTALIVGVGVGIVSALADPSVAGAAPPGAIVTRRADLDGDGREEEISLEASGAIGVRSGDRTLAPLVTLTTAGRAARGTIAVQRGGRGPIVLVTAELGGEGSSGEGVALRVQAGRIETLWRGALGPARGGAVRRASVDGGLRTWIERPEVRRCDGAAVELEAEGWDEARRAMRPIAPRLHVAAGAPRLVAAPGAGPPAIAALRRPLAFRRVAVSSQVGGDAAAEAAASELVDGDPATAWIEGRAGAGRGEVITLRALVPAGKVRAIRLLPGDGGDPARLRARNRLRRAALVVGTRAFWLELARDPATGGGLVPHVALLPEPIEADCVSLVIDRVWPEERARSNQGETAIAELAVVTDLELEPDGGGARLAAAVASGGRGAASAGRLLAELGPGGERALVAALGGANGEARRRILVALAAVPAAPDALARGLGDPLGAGERRAVRTALVRLGAASIAPLAAVLADREAAAAVRGEAAELLGELPGEAARAALLAALGQGGRPLRRAVAQAIARRSGAEAAALLAEAARLAGEAAAAGAEADLWRGLFGLAARAPDARPAIAAAAIVRLQNARGYERLARLIAGLAALGDPAGLAAVAEALRAAPARGVARHEAVALERIAVAGLAAAAGAGAGRGCGRGGGRGRGRGRERGRGRGRGRGGGGRARARARAGRGRGRAGAGAGAGAGVSGAARAALRGRARAADPGVREAVVEALATAAAPGDLISDAGVLADRLASDGWPRVRRRAAAALAGPCAGPASLIGHPARLQRGLAAPGRAALERALAGDADLEVRRVALGALVRCAPPGIADRVFALAADADQPGELRLEAIKQIARLAERRRDRGLTRRTIALFEDLRAAAWDDEGARPLAAAAAAALGALGDGGAAPALEAALLDSAAFPSIQAAIAAALGAHCPATAREPLEALVAGGEPEVQVAARGTIARCWKRRPR